MPRRPRDSEGPSDRRHQQQPRRTASFGEHWREERLPDQQRQGASEKLEARLERMERMISCLLPAGPEERQKARRYQSHGDGVSEMTPAWTSSSEEEKRQLSSRCPRPNRRRSESGWKSRQAMEEQWQQQCPRGGTKWRRSRSIRRNEEASIEEN